MIENVRLGAEVVGGQGGPAPDFPFAELYRVTFMKGKEIVAAKPGGRIVGPTEKIDTAWLVERTIGWLGNYRRLVVRYDRALTIYQAFFHIACFMIVLRRVLQ